MVGDVSGWPAVMWKHLNNVMLFCGRAVALVVDLAFYLDGFSYFPSAGGR
jgi:hypothetical protein